MIVSSLLIKKNLSIYFCFILSVLCSKTLKMLPSSKLNLGEEKKFSEEQHCDKSCGKELNSLNLAASVSINHHKRNRQSYSEKEKPPSESVTTQPTETYILPSEKGKLPSENPSERISIDIQDNISEKIDTQIDRCSVAKKPRDDINEMGDAGGKTSNVPPVHQAPSNLNFEKTSNFSIENRLSSEDISSNKYIHEDYR